MSHPLPLDEDRTASRAAATEEQAGSQLRRTKQIPNIASGVHRHFAGFRGGLRGFGVRVVIERVTHQPRPGSSHIWGSMACYLL